MEKPTNEKLYSMGIFDWAVWLITVGSRCSCSFRQRLIWPDVAVQKMLSNRTYLSHENQSRVKVNINKTHVMLLKVGVSTGPLMKG